MKHEYNTHIPG